MSARNLSEAGQRLSRPINDNAYSAHRRAPEKLTSTGNRIAAVHETDLRFHTAEGLVSRLRWLAKVYLIAECLDETA